MLKTSRPFNEIVAILAIYTTVVAVLINAFSPPRKKAVMDCGLNEIAVMEGYGEVSMHYITPMFRSTLPEWSVSFKSHPTTGFTFETEAKSPKLCEAVVGLYDKVMKIPMTMKEVRF